MLPVSHSTANAQIEVTLKADGTFVTASALSREEGLNTLIPVTDDSGARTSGVCAMPLADKLIYLCGDYSEYVDKNNTQYFKSYIEQLEHVLQVNEITGRLQETVNIAGIKQADAFVRFRVYGDRDEKSETWLDNSLYDSFISWNNDEMTSVGLCYATGKMRPITYKHPSKIRNTGDKSKLISANDESGFTYRGKFSDKTEAISVSYDFSQKMHNALRWLIKRQGIGISEGGKKKESMQFDTLQLFYAKYGYKNQIQINKQ